METLAHSTSLSFSLKLALCYEHLYRLPVIETETTLCDFMETRSFSISLSYPPSNWRCVMNTSTDCRWSRQRRLYVTLWRLTLSFSLRLALSYEHLYRLPVIETETALWDFMEILFEELRCSSFYSKVNITWCVFMKSCPFWYGESLYKIRQDFLDTQ